MNVIMSIAIPVNSDAHRILSEVESGSRSDLVRRAVESSVRLEGLENSQYLYRYIVGREVGMCIATSTRYDKKTTPVSGFQKYGNQQFPRCCQECYEQYTIDRLDDETRKDWKLRLKKMSMVDGWIREVWE